ncbi:hypothetical protein J3A83DRAFT_4371542 [Scleroderma citrinum]
MAYHHYRPTVPGWSTNEVHSHVRSTYNMHADSYDQLRFHAAPPVQFQPQPYWRGINSFRAHPPDIDRRPYYLSYDTVDDADRIIPGVGLHEARLWHYRAYGDVRAVNYLSPKEIGYASAYEAYRRWIYNSSLHNIHGGQYGQHREALIDLAVAEASRLYGLVRPQVSKNKIAACETAEATASTIFHEVTYYGPQYEAGGSSPPQLSGYDCRNGVANGNSCPRAWASGIDSYVTDHNMPCFLSRMTISNYGGDTRPRRNSLPGPMSRPHSPYRTVSPYGGDGCPYIRGPGKAPVGSLLPPAMYHPASGFTAISRPNVAFPSRRRRRSSISQRRHHDRQGKC